MVGFSSLLLLTVAQVGGSGEGGGRQLLFLEMRLFFGTDNSSGGCDESHQVMDETVFVILFSDVM